MGNEEGTQNLLGYKLSCVVLVVTALATISVTPARACLIPLRLAANYTVLYEGTGSTYPPPLAFEGTLLAPNDAMPVTNANLVGRLFGGDSHMQIVSGSSGSIDGPSPNGVSEPSTLMLLGSGIAGFAYLTVRRRHGARS